MRSGNLTSFFSVASYIAAPVSRQAHKRLVKIAVSLGQAPGLNPNKLLTDKQSLYA
jgi:hypothetical protein